MTTESNFNVFEESDIEIIDNIQGSDRIYVQTDQGLAFVNFEDFIIGTENITFVSTLTGHTQDISTLRSDLVTVSGAAAEDLSNQITSLSGSISSIILDTVNTAVSTNTSTLTDIEDDLTTLTKALTSRNVIFLKNIAITIPAGSTSSTAVFEVPREIVGTGVGVQKTNFNLTATNTIGASYTPYINQVLEDPLNFTYGVEVKTNDEVVGTAGAQYNITVMVQYTSSIIQTDDRGLEVISSQTFPEGTIFISP